jgi:probable F420-dependent oxidoreductase
VQVDVRLDAELAQVPDVVRSLEDAGVGGLFTYEGPRDPFLPLAVAGPVAQRVHHYTNLANALPRSPMHLAYTAHDLQRASGGRFALGLGTQVQRHITQRYGGTWESPVEQLRECLLAVRAIQQSWQDGTPMDFEGRWTRHTYCPPLFDPGPVPGGLTPLYVGAVGPRMVTMATQVADGLLVHPFCTARSLAEHTWPLVDAGLAGRTGFTLIGQATVAVGRTAEELARARDAVRSLVCFYVSTPAYRFVLDVHGWGDLQPALRELTRAGRWADLTAAVPDEVVDAVAVSGDPDEVAHQLADRYARCDRVGLSMPYDVPIETLRALVSAAAGL